VVVIPVGPVCPITHPVAQKHVLGFNSCLHACLSAWLTLTLFPS